MSEYVASYICACDIGKYLCHREVGPGLYILCSNFCLSCFLSIAQKVTYNAQYYAHIMSNMPANFIILKEQTALLELICIQACSTYY